MIQWHPLFVALLRPVVERYYEVTTNVPVGDLPRQADIVLLRRTAIGDIPFQGLWRHLTSWNVLEFKPPTARPRLEHLEQLLEVGLGVGRRLNEDRQRDREPRLDPAEISFWYLADTPARRILRLARDGLVGFQEQEAGLWRGEVLGHPVYIVRGKALPVVPESLPFHVIGARPASVEDAVKDLVLADQELFARYTQWLSSFHPRIYQEIQAVAKTKKWEPEISILPMVDLLGLDRVMQAIGVDRVVHELGAKRILQSMPPQEMIEGFGPDSFVKALTPEFKEVLRRLLK